MSGPRDPAPRPRGAFVLLRLAALIAFVLLAAWISHQVRGSLEARIGPDSGAMMQRAVLFGTLAYVVLLALPFVPGAEIGIVLLTAFGASVAPLIYLATVLAMLLAYAIGHFVPIGVLAEILSLLRLHRAAALVERVAQLPREARAELLLEHAPPGLVARALRHRYLAVALALNLPGNSVLGGGGGIMMLAGMSGIFAPLPTALAVMVAVAPVPAAIVLFGAVALP